MENTKIIHKPLISIIIPVYNVETYLAEALDSVINQTYEKLEILIIDDGSTDGSGAICDEYAFKDERIRVMHQENRGLSAARNAGLNCMTGELCAFLDSDDAFESTFIEKMLAAMLHEEADLVVCKYTVHQTEKKLYLTDEQARPSADSGNYDRIHALRALADGIINVAVWNKLYRRTLWQNIRFPEGRYYEDYETTLRIFNICHLLHVLDEPLYLYRKRQGSITSTPSIKIIRDKNLAYSHFASFIEANTPEIFNASQKQNWHQFLLNDIIIYYLNHTAGRSYEEITFRKELRKYIILTGKETGIKTFGLRTRIAWYMIRFCPMLLKIVYRVYLPVRLKVFKIIGR